MICGSMRNAHKSADRYGPSIYIYMYTRAREMAFAEKLLGCNQGKVYFSGEGRELKSQDLMNQIFCAKSAACEPRLVACRLYIRASLERLASKHNTMSHLFIYFLLYRYFPECYICTPPSTTSQNKKKKKTNRQ